MANYLLLGTATEPWRLHVTESPSDVLDRLAKATGPVEVVAVFKDQLEPQVIWVNPAATPWWTVHSEGD